MSSVVRIVLAAIVAAVLMGLATVPMTPDQVHWKTAGPEVPVGG